MRGAPLQINGRENTAMPLLSSSSGRQNVYWDTLVKKARNQCLENMSLINDLDPHDVPNKQQTGDAC